MSMSVIVPQKGDPGPYPLQNAASDGNGAALDADGVGSMGFYITFDEDAVSGAVQIETGVFPDDSYAWAPLGDPIEASPGGIEQVTVPGPLAFVRARISVPITGGTVTVVAFVTY